MKSQIVIRIVRGSPRCERYGAALKMVTGALGPHCLAICTILYFIVYIMVLGKWQMCSRSGEGAEGVPQKKLLFFWILSIMGRNILSVTSPFNTPPPSSRRQSYASNFLINIAQNNLPQTIYELSPNYVIINNVAFDTIAP